MNGKDMKFNTLPVGKLAILVHPSCETLGNLIDQHLTNWRKARETDENEAMHYQDYVRDTFIIPSTCARFGTGEAKALLHDSVRGVDLYILADVLNYSLEYTVSGHRNHMSPDDIYADIKRLIAAASGILSSIPCPPDGTRTASLPVSSFCRFQNSIALSTLPRRSGGSVPS